MNRRSFFTGLATLAVWPMAIRSRPRRDVRVFTPIPDTEPFRYTVPEPTFQSTTLKTHSGRLVEYIHRIDLAPEMLAEEKERIMST